MGQSAELAEMEKEDFIKFLGENKVSVFKYDSAEELVNDLKKA